MWLALFWGIVFANFFPSVKATNMSVELTVGETTLVLNGYTCPGCLVNIYENNAIIGNTTANSLGVFSKTITALTDGVHTVGLKARDSLNNTSSLVEYSVALTLGSITTINNIVMPPTVVIPTTTVLVGSTLSSSGYSAPSASVLMYILSLGIGTTITTDNNGYWSGYIDTSSISPGSYNLQFKTVISGGLSGEWSGSYPITVSPLPTATPTPLATATPGSGPTNTPGPAATATPTPVLNLGPIKIYLPTETNLPFFELFKTNKEKGFSLDKLLIVAKSWVEFWRTDKVTICDLNVDRYCDIYDFSILMSYVGK